MEIKKGYHSFYMGESEENPSGIITYVPLENGKILADHTIIKEELKGKGAGKILLEALIQYAREENLKIVPQCPFVKDQMEKTAEYKDLIAE